ncbi:MAG: AAA family ATPase [Gaiellaceae bacterium]
MGSNGNINPFRYGAIARGEFFANRRAELKQLVADVRGGQDVVIISPRRLGKTSLVERAIEELRGEGALVAYLDLLGSPSKEQLADNLAQALNDGLLSPLERTIERVREFFSHLTLAPRLTVSDDAKPVVQFLGYEREEDADKLLEGLLALPAELGEDRLVVVVLDEFQEIVTIDEDLPGKIRAIFQRQPEVSHVYLGSKRHLMEPLFMNASAPLYRAAKPMPVGPIAPHQFSGFLRERFRAGGVDVSDEALECILSLTEGKPYETQELCSFTWTQARLRSTGADVEAVELALDDLLRAESARYTAVWERLSTGQRMLLLALSRQSGRVYSEGYRRRHKLDSAASVQTALESLGRLDLIERPDSGGYALADVFMCRWLRQFDHRSGPRS